MTKQAKLGVIGGVVWVCYVCGREEESEICLMLHGACC